MLNIKKRDGRIVAFDILKIKTAILKAQNSIKDENLHIADELSEIVKNKLDDVFISDIPTVEQVQNIVEETLMSGGYTNVARQYVLYRNERTNIREMNSDLMKIFEGLTFNSSKENEIKRENANIDGDTAMGTMLKYGSESAKKFYEMYLIDKKHSQAHINGDIHIHDMDFFALTTTCCQIDIDKLFEGGFNTGHGYIREPQSIRSYASLACIAIQSNQNEQHGGQSIPNFDYTMAKGVRKTYKKLYFKALKEILDFFISNENIDEIILEVKENLKDFTPAIKENIEVEKRVKEVLLKYIKDEALIDNIIKKVTKHTLKNTQDETLQAMEALIHNLNTMHSRAGAQIPFSSINYGLDVTEEGRLVMKSILQATQRGLGNGETPIFPIQIFKVKDGINYNKGEPNYDLFIMACETSAKRLFPNFSFIDAPFNIKYYKEGKPETEIAYMGCRTRVVSNVYDKEQETIFGRGNLSFTSINLPRLAIESKKDIGKFYELLDEKLNLVVEQLLYRLKIQSQKKVRNFPFLMGQGIWLGSDKLSLDDSIAEVLKHGTLSVGFIGLAEALVSLIGVHHGESEQAQQLGINIIKFMRDKMDEKCQEYKLNFSLIGTPAESLSGRFVNIDKKKYGIIKGVTDKEYYTNSFHIPVSFNISAFRKIELEAPYHELTNAGHITYVELDSSPTANIPAFVKIIKHMKECGIGYGSINHPLDRDSVCGFSGVIGNTCPQCGREESDEQPFYRIRRITGYLVGSLERFNTAKLSEVKDRVKHD